MRTMWLLFPMLGALAGCSSDDTSTADAGSDASFTQADDTDADIVVWPYHCLTRATCYTCPTQAQADQCLNGEDSGCTSADPAVCK